MSEFIESWDLFGHVYLSGWLITLLLALVGVLVVAKEQIFVSAAVSQASTLGIALGMVSTMLFGEWGDSRLGSDTLLSAMAILFAVLAALVTEFVRGARRESPEAVTGWIFLVSASGSILLLSHNPHGLEEINRLLSSSLIGASQWDLWLISLLLTASILILVLFHRPLLLLALDPTMARALGLRVKSWGIAQGVWLGLTAGISMRISGLLFTFGCLVLPALVAKNICREIRSMFIVAPLTGVSTAIVGFVLADYYDFPPAQMTVALLCGLLCCAWLIRGVRPHS